MPIPAEYAKKTPTVLERIRANIDAQYSKRRVCPPDNDPLLKNVTEFGTGQITLTTVPQMIVGYRGNRIGVKITNLSTTVEVFIGCGFGVSASNGDLLSAGRGQWNSYDTHSPIYGVVAAGTANVAFAEVYE